MILHYNNILQELLSSLMEDYDMPAKRLSTSGRPLVVGCHPGVFHADEVFSIAALKQLAPDLQVIRSRQPEEWQKCDLLVDVGLEFNPLEGKYDHHQEGFDQYHPAPNDRFDYGPKKSGFGLIWDAYGSEVIRHVLAKRTIVATDENLEQIWEEVRRSLVAYVDLCDNGQQKEFHATRGTYPQPNIVEVIRAINPVWLEMEKNTGRDDEFATAVGVATLFLIREIIRAAGVVFSRDEILEGAKNATRLLIFEKYRPWASIFSANYDLTSHIELVMFPSDNGWMVQSPYNRGKYLPKLRTPVPANLRGKSSGELRKLVPIADMEFAHVGGHLSGTKSREGALQWAQWLLQYKDDHPDYNPNPPF